MQLTTGFCHQIASSTSPQDPVWTTSAILQILQAKELDSNGRKLRRIVISDGAHLLQVLVSDPQLNTLFEDGHVKKNSVVRIECKMSQPINGRRQVIPRIYNLPVVIPLNAPSE